MSRTAAADTRVDHFDAAETQASEAREASLFQALPGFLQKAKAGAPGLARWLAGVDTEALTSREAMVALPVLRKAELLEMQAENPPFGGFVDPAYLRGKRVFMSPGPIWEPEGPGDDPAQAARAFFAAGIRPGDTVHNAFSYHLTPGGTILDKGARALGCTVFPGGVGNTDAQVEAAAFLKPSAYSGTPDFLKLMLDRAAEMGKDLSSFKRGLVSGGALFPSLRAEYKSRGVDIFQCYATAEFGVIAYETVDAGGNLNPGMVLNENLIVEIVRPGTGDPVAEGEVGEVVVTGFNPAYPLIRLGTGDMSRFLPEPSPCGRTNARIAGWLGRADQRTKVKGMFVDPKQIAEIVKRHPAIARARLVVTRADERDRMELKVEPRNGEALDTTALGATLREVTKLSGAVSAVRPGELPNDGKVIADERDYAK